MNEIPNKTIYSMKVKSTNENVKQYYVGIFAYDLISLYITVNGVKM